MNKKTILFIHQSSELYGSDKTLFYLVKDLKNTSNFNPVVVLPSEGPLSIILNKENIRVIVAPVVKVSRKMFKLKNLFFLPIVVLKAVKNLEKELKGEKVDLVHSNTLAVLLGAFYSKRKNIKHLWHVHEIIEHPKIISKIYPILVDKFSDFVIYNSNASKEALLKNRASLKGKSQVIWNGLKRVEPKTSNLKVAKIRRTLYKIKDKDTIVIGLVGRINRWKGHLLLLEAYREVLKKNLNTKLVFIGSTPPNQDTFKEIICSKINKLGLEEHCEIIPFNEHIWPIYDSLDIVVIPSTEPEPFGLVAVEAMLSEKIVIAANHGGLCEIVQHNKTGLLFEPNNPKDLKRCLNKVIQKKDVSKQLAKSGLQLSKTVFSLERYLYSFKKKYLRILS